MTAKEYLSQVIILEKKINWYAEEIERLEALAEKTTGTIKNDKVQVSVDQQKMEVAITRLMDYKNEVVNTLNEYVEKRRLIMDQINKLKNNNYREILCRRYIDGKTFEMIAVDLGYSWRHVIRMHGSSLEAFREQFLPNP